jgi:hypothetical protein
VSFATVFAANSAPVLAATDGTTYSRMPVK